MYEVLVHWYYRFFFIKSCLNHVILIFQQECGSVYNQVIAAVKQLNAAINRVNKEQAAKMLAEEEAKKKEEALKKEKELQAKKEAAAAQAQQAAAPPPNQQKSAAATIQRQSSTGLQDLTAKFSIFCS